MEIYLIRSTPYRENLRPTDYKKLWFRLDLLKITSLTHTFFQSSQMFRGKLPCSTFYASLHLRDSKQNQNIHVPGQMDSPNPRRVLPLHSSLKILLVLVSDLQIGYHIRMTILNDNKIYCSS